MANSAVYVKRAYEKPLLGDGLRILVDRLWPRGLRKEAARIDIWLKEISPSDELRKWFAHDPSKWPEFVKRYAEELKGNPEAVSALKSSIGSRKKVTLLFSAKDEERNNAVALKKILRL